MFRSRWMKAVSVLASIVVFVTVYMLILPAATITPDDAPEAEGFYLSAEADMGIESGSSEGNAEDHDSQEAPGGQEAQDDQQNYDSQDAHDNQDTPGSQGSSDGQNDQGNDSENVSNTGNTGDADNADITGNVNTGENVDDTGNTGSIAEQTGSETGNGGGTTAADNADTGSSPDATVDNYGNRGTSEGGASQAGNGSAESVNAGEMTIAPNLEQDAAGVSSADTDGVEAAGAEASEPGTFAEGTPAEAGPIAEGTLIEEEEEETEEETEAGPAAGTKFAENGLEWQDGQMLVRVSFDEKAKIPAGSVLEVIPLEKGTEEHRAYYRRALTAGYRESNELAEEEIEKRVSSALAAYDAELAGGKSISNQARIFDIKIRDAEGIEIEPADQIGIDISFINGMTVRNDARMKLVHFAGEEQAEPASDNAAETFAETESDAPEADAGAVGQVKLLFKKAARFLGISERSAELETAAAESGLNSTDEIPVATPSDLREAKLLTKEDLSAEADEDYIRRAEILPVTELSAGNTAVSGMKEIQTISFSTASLSVYALVYTVDFHWGVNGNQYDLSIPGGGFVSLGKLMEALGIENGGAVLADLQDDSNDFDLNSIRISESTKQFLSDVEKVEFSNPELVWIGKVETDTTVGAIRSAHGLEPQYSAELTAEQIEAINAQTVEAGDWAFISVRPFTSEETLTVTMKNGEQWSVKVTDAQVVPDAEATTIDVNKSYLIVYQADGKYYLLKNDGSVDDTKTPANSNNFEDLNSTYAWTFSHVFKEKDVDTNLDNNYYLIRPIDHKAKTIALNYVTTEANPLVQAGNNNTGVVAVEGGGFILQGYHNIGTEENHRYIQLGFVDGAFKGIDGQGVTVHIYEMDSLPTYDYTVRSADEVRGTVIVSDGTQQTVSHEGEADTHYYAATSSHDKKNAGTISAVPVTHINGGQNKWEFDYWEQDGIKLDRDQYPATISADSLLIPFNGSKLTAYFRKNPDYVVPENEKEPSSIEDMQGWLETLQNREIPLEGSVTEKTAEVYDYQNRIYRVDVNTKANFQTFAGSLDMAFCLDVSNSMYFPSSLVETISANHSNPMPIYRINNNKNWLDTSRGYSDPYYLIADPEHTSTVFKIYYKDGSWKAQDASRETESDRSFVIGEDFKTTWTAAQYDSTTNPNKNHPFNSGDDDNSRYVIYDAGDNGKNRFYYLNESLGTGSSDLNTITELLEVAGDASPDVRIAYNTFNKDLGKLENNELQRQDFASAERLQIDLSRSHGGGTRPDQAFNDAQNFNWTANYTRDGNGDLTATDRYVVLVTDGAPQGIRTGESNLTTTQIENIVRDAAQDLKNKAHVKLITIGLSMENVTSGKRLLYDLADEDSSGNKMFYLAEKASDLTNIFRQITKTLMEDVVVLGDITDTAGEGFYLVNKATGLPLKAGDKIDIEGILTTDDTKAAGTVQPDGRTIIWKDQGIDSVTGWHGVVYVKAQEELLGGNAVQTNSGEATVVATKYRTGGRDVAFDTTLVRNTLKLSTSLPSPRVNVNELTFFNNNTEWTVYLGEEVDPKQQLRAIYDSLVVEEVVNTDGSLHYTIGPNSIEERWDTATGTAATFSLPGLLEKLIRKDTAMAAKYFEGDNLKWDDFLTDIMSTGGITLPYHEYGLTDGGNIVITLEKTIANGEESNLVRVSPHVTTVTGDNVEKYVLRIQYSPDYSVTPVGQGGQSAEDFHTGTYGSMYQGHAAGRETSTNTHVINVYSVPLDVYKTDESNEPLAGAVFKLYREDTKNGVQVEGLDSAKKFTEVSESTSGTDGIALLKQDGQDIEPVKGETYYLIETSAPDGYKRLDTVWTVEVQTEIGAFTNLGGNVIYSVQNPDPEADPPVIVENGVSSNMYPFNWDQGARMMLDGSTPVPIIGKGTVEGTTSEVTDAPFVTAENAIAFRHKVVNLIGGNIGITVNKVWEDEDQPPASVTVKLYRVSEKDHQWGSGRVVPSSCTAEGVKEYTCSECGKTDTYAINEAGHVRGAEHRENDSAAACTADGGYDTVVRCKVCNAIISTAHTEIPATGHDWGEWTVTTAAQPGVAGVETRVCRNDPTHTETREIPALPVPHTVTIVFQCLGNGNGGTSSNPTYIATRTGTGIGDMTIEWNWDQWTNPQPFTVEGLGTSAWSKWCSGDNKGELQRLLISNISNDLNITVTIDNSNYRGTNNSLIGQPQFSGESVQSTLNSAKKAAGRKALQSMSESSDNSLRSGEGGQPVAMTQAQLTEYLDSLKKDNQVSCAENLNAEQVDEADHTYVEEAGTYTITANDNWTLPITGLPKINEYGKEYTYYVVEDVTGIGDGYEITYAGLDDGLQDGGTATIRNKKLKGSLLITKNVLYNGRAASTDAEKALVNGSYQFTVKKGGVEIAGSPFTISVANGVSNSVLITDLQAGSDYTIEETGSGNLTFKEAAGGTAVSGSTVTVTVTAGKQTEAELDASAKAVFTNNYTAYEIIIVKVDTGNSETKLGGAKFALYPETTVKEDKTLKEGAVPLKKDLISSANTEDKGKVSLGALTPGVYYLFETEAPAGYNMMDMPVMITVHANQVTLLQGSRSQTEVIAQERAELMVTNSAGVELPHTGGSGTRIFTILGSILIAGAGLLLWKRRKTYIF